MTECNEIICECCTNEVDYIHDDTQMCDECHREAGISREESRNDLD
jgi:hypothetical protein